MRIFLLALLGLLSCPLAAQTFMRAYSNLPFSQSSLLLPEDAIQMSDGRFVLTGFEGFWVHTDAAGVPIRTLDIKDGLGGPLSSINLSLLAEAGPGQVFVVGNTSADTVFAMKLDLGGGIVWQRSYRTPSNQPRTLLATPDGGLLVLASTGRGLSQSAIPILTRLDADGDLVWQRRYYNADPAVGRMNWYNVSRTANGDYLVTGTTVPASPLRILVVRLSSIGAVLWAREFAPSSNNNEHGVAVAELVNGQIRVVVNNPVPGSEFGTVLLSASGDLLSAGAYSGGGANMTHAHIQSDGSVTGALTNLSTVVKLAPDGTPAFARSYDLQNGSFLLLSEIFPSSDGGLISFGGYAFSFFGDFACTLFKTAADGLLPPGFHTPVVLNPQAYAPSLSSVSLGDSAGLPLLASQIGVIETTMVYDTLFGTPPLALRDRLPVGIDLFPNPATDRLTLTWEQPLEGPWEVQDLAGRT
ncbi:MAG: hypothetical protein OHK0039_39850 [Bacteroidia bacterium]